MFELEIKIKRNSLPFRVTGVEDEERVREVIKGFLAAYGIPAPDDLRDTGVSTFAERMAETGVYKHDSSEIYVLAKRSE